MLLLLLLLCLLFWFVCDPRKSKPPIAMDILRAVKDMYAWTVRQWSIAVTMQMLEGRSTALAYNAMDVGFPRARGFATGTRATYGIV